jgi:DNA-binding CsgD family transcriptional regulator
VVFGENEFDRAGPQEVGFLPAETTSLVGLDAEQTELASRILGSADRLLTLTGPGGVGKTKLALRVAHDVQAQTGHPAGFVSLAEAEHPAEALQHCTTALAADGLWREVSSPGSRLLVLDGCERETAEIGRIVASLLSVRPRLTVLATSRRRLRVYGENLVPMRTLPMPMPMPYDDLERLGQCPSVQLLVERARSVSPQFSLTPGNAVPVATLCRMVDGLPLALELAADRLRFHPVESVLAHVRDNGAALAVPLFGQPQRHWSIAASVEWSLPWLDDDERVLLDRLAVFNAAFSFGAVVATSPLAPAESGNALEGLIEANLVEMQLAAAPDRENSDGHRFRLLRSIRDVLRARQRGAAGSPAPLVPQPRRRLSPVPGAGLTSRQVEVAQLVADGLTNRQIASKLGIAEWTVVNHLRQVMQKLDCSSRVQVARALFGM